MNDLLETVIEAHGGLERWNEGANAAVANARFNTTGVRVLEATT